MWLSRKRHGQLEELRILCGKDSIAAVLDEAIEVYAQCRIARDLKAFESLAPRLQQVLCLIADGQSTKEIAARLEISKKTVEFHRRRLGKQLGIQTVARLARFAARVGAVPL
ncbi:MAG TPA: LuxR C-terminal-related transcriptional regulator [Gemmataceae bacterium]|nr:LuxR C-terminal-related transcriptional regulator [Gemmataceae bacterium]